MSVTVTANNSRAVVSGTAISVAVAPAVSIIQAGSGGASTIDAENVAIADAGNYYTSSNVEGALQELGGSLSNIDGQLSSLDGRVTTAEGNISTLQGEVFGLTVDVGGLDTRLTSAEGNITTLQGDVSDLDGRVITSESNITTLQNDVANIVEPQSGQGIEVGVAGAVNLGGGNAISGDRTITLAENASLKVSSFLGFEAIFSQTAFILQIDNKVWEFDQDGGLVITNTGVNSAQYSSTIQTLTNSAGSIAWNLALGHHARITLSASGTLQNPTNLPLSVFAIFPSLEVIQDATGGRVLSFGSAYKFADGYTAPATAGNSRILYNFYLRSDGNIGVVSTYYVS